ncbi:MAG: hypothetical protein U0796_21680 [Gemmatales bacterium]
MIHFIALIVFTSPIKDRVTINDIINSHEVLIKSIDNMTFSMRAKSSHLPDNYFMRKYFVNGLSMKCENTVDKDFPNKSQLPRYDKLIYSALDGDYSYMINTTNGIHKLVNVQKETDATKFLIKDRLNRTVFSPYMVRGRTLRELASSKNAKLGEIQLLQEHGKNIVKIPIRYENSSLSVSDETTSYNGFMTMDKDNMYAIIQLSLSITYKYENGTKTRPYERIAYFTDALHNNIKMPATVSHKYGKSADLTNESYEEWTIEGVSTLRYSRDLYALTAYNLPEPLWARSVSVSIPWYLYCSLIGIFMLVLAIYILYRQKKAAL